jgi:toxin ParE1/3/4
MKPFQLTIKAKSDLKDIALFTARRWGREQRNIYLKQFDESFWLLAEHPDIGKTCDEIRDGYRKFPQGSHVIFYKQIGSQNIQIIRILHKSMDVDPVFRINVS